MVPGSGKGVMPHLSSADDAMVVASMPASGRESERATFERTTRLTRALEFEVIPRLILSHRRASPRSAAESLPTHEEVEAFADHVVRGDEAAMDALVRAYRRDGVSVENLYLELLGPVARRLGRMWEDDDCDFSTVTLGVGRLQRLLRELSPAFSTEAETPPNGRRALLAQPPQEQHCFGLSMVAEFFRRSGWEVHGGVGGAVTDPAAKARSEWFDLAGLSIGSETRLEWLRECIGAIRAASRNRSIAILVGGPVFHAHPEWVSHVGADGTARDGRDAPLLAEKLVAGRAWRT